MTLISPNQHNRIISNQSFTYSGFTRCFGKNERRIITIILKVENRSITAQQINLNVKIQNSHYSKSHEISKKSLWRGHTFVYNSIIGRRNGRAQNFQNGIPLCDSEYFTVAYSQKQKEKTARCLHLLNLTFFVGYD